MARYTVRLRVKAAKPLNDEQLRVFNGDRHNTRTYVHVSDHDLRVTLFMDSADPLGAVSRAANYVLDRIPGELIRIEAWLDDTSR